VLEIMRRFVVERKTAIGVIALLEVGAVRLYPQKRVENTGATKLIGREEKGSVDLATGVRAGC
jgi:hypothetical protein